MKPWIAAALILGLAGASYWAIEIHDRELSSHKGVMLGMPMDQAVERLEGVGYLQTSPFVRGGDSVDCSNEHWLVPTRGPDFAIILSPGADCAVEGIRRKRRHLEL